MSKQLTQKAVIYIRVSTDRQAEKGTSLKTQREKCQAYAKENGYGVMKVFSEEGETAKAWQRPELLDMIAYLQKNKKKVDALIVYKLDRLSRNTDDQHAIMYKLQQANVDLRSATENIDDSAVGKFMRSVLWAVAEFDNAIRGERTRDGMYSRFQDGYWPFAAPSGYISGKDEKTNRNLPVPHPEYGKLITWAAKQRATGVPYMEIAAKLKKRGFKTRQGNAPTGQHVFKMMHNTFYIGMMKAFGEKMKGRHKSLISYDVWLKMRVADGEAANPATQRTKFNPAFPLAQTLYCPECGVKLRGSHTTKKNGTKYPYYHHYNPECEKSGSYTKAIVHDAFMVTLQDVKPRKKHLELFKAVVLDLAKSKSTEQSEQAERFERQLKKLRTQRNEILDGIAADPRFELMPREEWLARRDRIENEIQEVSVEQSKYVKAEVDVQKYLTRCLAALTDPAHRWETYKRIEHKVEFAREIFPDNVFWAGEDCRTAKLSPLMHVLSQYPSDEKKLAARRGIEPLFPA